MSRGFIGALWLRVRQQNSICRVCQALGRGSLRRPEHPCLRGAAGTGGHGAVITFQIVWLLL